MRTEKDSTTETRSDYPVLVTGASGNAGAALVEILLERGRPFRAAGTRPERLRERFGEIDAVELDFFREETFGPALEGMKGLFLVRPPAVGDVKHTLNPFLDEAARRGIEHVVFLSIAGAESKPWVPHRAVELHLERGPLSWTFLRAGFFAQNFTDAYRDDVREGLIRLPAGRGRVAFVDVRDLAEVAADAFEDRAAHDRRAWTLTGGEAVDFAEAAAMLSEVLGASISYSPVSLPAYARHLRRRGTPWMAVVVMAFLHRGLRYGAAEQIDPTLERLLGRRPRALRAFFEDYAGLLKGDAPRGEAVRLL